MNLSKMIILWFLFVLGVVLGYNLDTEHLIVYHISNFNNSKRATYFGMSVAIRSNAASLQDSWIIQIGAPKDNIDNMKVNEPGTIYRCHIYGPCQMFLLEKTYNNFGGQGAYLYRDKKDEAWIGGSMDVKVVDSHEMSVVCGHRWINQNLKNPENIDVTYLMTGVCYLQELLNGTSEAPVDKLLPLVDIDKIYTPKPYVVDLSTYHWGLGQAGISVKLLEETSSIIIGAPGVTHWIGSVVQYESDLKLTVGNFMRTEFSKKNRYTYLGYSVAAGKFYKDRKLWLVAGAPRSSNYRGEVYIFKYQDFSDNIIIHSNLVGTTFGEYFGSSLTTCDLNGDGADDLIVGAPLSSNNDPDEGRIYAYVGSTNTNFLLQSQMVNGQSSNGRFGSSISCIDDLDQDGYMDVAVGAPYEDDQKGAVYIYRGFALGLRTEYSQRISAQEIYPQLRGFGISISSPVDTDGNKYQDIVVGSYLSGHAVLLRSRPVISINSKVEAGDFPLIDRLAHYVNVTICSRYTGSNPPKSADVWRIIDFDAIYRRGSLDKSKQMTFSKSLIRLKANEFFCETYTVYLDLFSKEYSPLLINVKSELPPCSNSNHGPLLIRGEKTDKTDGFLKWCPFGENEEITKELAFAGICGDDSVCRSDLKLACHITNFRNDTYILGSSEFLVLSMTLQNFGEPAQNTKIKIWSNIKIISHNKFLNSLGLSKNTFWVDVEGTLTDSYHSNFTFRIPLEEVKTSDWNLIVEVFTSSIDINSANNRCRFSPQLVSDASVSLHSSSSLASFLISKKNSQDQILNTTHYYEVRKTGQTPLKEAELVIYIPSRYNTDFLSFEIETSEWMQFSAHYEDVLYNENESSPPKANFATFSLTETCPPTNLTLFLNCSNQDIKCHVYHVYFVGGVPTAQSSYTKILIFLNITSLDSVKGEKNIVHLSTLGVLKFTNYLSNKTVELYETASISLYNEEIEPAVDALVVGLSILAGGFLLSLIVTCLVKNNFFKRSKKEELEALKEAEINFIYFATRNEINQDS